MTTKDFLFTAAAVFTVALGFWFFSNYGLVRKSNVDITAKSTTTTTQTARVQRAAQSVPTPTAAVTSANATTSTTSSAASAPNAATNTTTNPNTLMAARQQLELERQKLALQRQSLDSLKARRDTNVQQLNNDFPLVIGTNSLQIQNLLDDLQNQRLAANDVKDNADAALREQISAAQLSRDEIDLNIQNTEQSLQRTRDALALGMNSVLAGTTDEQTRYQGLQTDLAVMTEQLRQLKEQRVNISATVYQQTRNINSLSQSQRENLTSNQNDIQQQISSLREENNRLQNQSTETRMSLMPLSQQISRAEQAYQDSLNKVKALEQSTVVR